MVLFLQGTIEIDHEQQKLDMVVYPQHGSSQGSGQTHILSGGERSYSTVAFLHALWQVMEYPFYFLDEFDVFMVSITYLFSSCENVCLYLNLVVA